MKSLMISAALALGAQSAAWADEPRDAARTCTLERAHMAHEVREHRLELEKATDEAQGRSARRVFEAFRGLDQQARQIMWDLRDLERRCPGSVVFLKEDDARKTADASGAL